LGQCGRTQKLRYKRVELQGRKRHTRQEISKGQAALNALEGALRLVEQQVKDGIISTDAAKELQTTLRTDYDRIAGEIDQGRLIEAALGGNLDMLDYLERNWLHGVH